MTPKEKATHLVESFRKVFRYLNKDAMKYEAKKCALIAVDEIIKSNPTNPLKGGYIEIYSDMIDEAISYWQEVKKEIEKL